MAPPGNTALPPLPGPGGVTHGTAGSNPWSAPSVPPPPPPPRPGPYAAPFPGLGHQVPLVDRAPRWIVAVAVAVVVALLAGAAQIVLNGGRSFPSAWDPKVAGIADWVARERKLSFKHPVEVQFLTAAEYTKASTGDDPADPDAAPAADPEEDQAMQDGLAQLRALGLIEGDVDLGKASKTLSDSGSLAYYSPETEQVYVRGSTMTPGLRVTLAHELTHVLQDQNFDLERIDDLSSGRAGVLRAVAEGDATRIEDLYSEKVLSDAERAQYEKDSAAEGDDSKDKIDEAEVPPVLTAFFASPYIFGPELVTALEQRSKTSIDEALQDPPTEEVLWDPRLFASDAAKPVKVEVRAPKGTTQVDPSDDFGPTSWYLLLAARIDPKLALTAVDGLGGDAYVVFRKPDKKVCVNATIVGDTQADTDQMHMALQQWADKGPAGVATVEQDAGRIHFQSCDPGSKATGLGTVSIDLFGLPVSRTQVYDGVLEEGGSTTQANCFADGIINTFSYAELQGDYISGDEGQQKLVALRASCR